MCSCFTLWNIVNNATVRKCKYKFLCDSNNSFIFYIQFSEKLLSQWQLVYFLANRYIVFQSIFQFCNPTTVSDILTSHILIITLLSSSTPSLVAYCGSDFHFLMVPQVNIFRVCGAIGVSLCNIRQRIIILTGYWFFYFIIFSTSFFSKKICLKEVIITVINHFSIYK